MPVKGGCPGRRARLLAERLQLLAELHSLLLPFSHFQDPTQAKERSRRLVELMSVKFMVYDVNDNLDSKAAYLDSKGFNTSIPSNCVTCHGGSAAWDNTN